MNNSSYFQPISDKFFFDNAKGKVRFGMTNDYMFRAVLQESVEGLRGLIASLLHLEPDQISVEITNPILIGKAITDKEFRFDLNIIINGKIFVNLEMQNINTFWDFRSLLYLSRSFDNILRGKSYDSVMSVIHIGLLNFSMSKSHPEFYSSCCLMNEKTHEVFNKDFSLRCIDLTNICLATKEDKLYNIDKWATFLKADSWEVIKMLASQDPHIKDAAKRLYLANTDEQLRNLAFDIEEHQLFIRSMKSKIATLTRENEEMSAAIAKEKADNERLRSLLAENNINFDL